MHLDQLVQQYRDQWIAVENGTVLAAGHDLRTVTDASRALSSSPDIAYEFIASGSMIF